MSQAIHLASRFSLPLEAAADVIAILGRRGRGKTTTATVLVEELHAAGHRFCVADPVGVWWGLKSSRDGKGPGIPVVVMGGDRGDVPLEDTAGKVIADFVADPTGPSVVLDFRAFRKGQMTRFMTDFLEQLYHRNRHPLHLVLDEADQFAPQRFTGDVARLVGAAEDVCKMGRARGLHPIVITQRPAALNKNVLTQAGILIVHGLTGPQDIKAVEAWIHERADEEHRTEVLSSLPGLSRGQAWVWAPELEILRQVEVRDRETFDSSATPKGEALKGPRVLAEVDLAKLKERIASTIEKAKAEDPRELRKTIADLRAKLAAAEKVKPAPATRKAPRVVEKSILKEAHVKGLDAIVTRMEKAVLGAEAAAGMVYAQAQVIKAALAAARVHTQREGAAVGGSRPGVPAAAPHTHVVERRGATPPAPRTEPRDARVSRPQQVILDALAYFESISVSSPSRRQVALVARVSSVSSGYEKNVGTLRTNGLIELPGPNLLRLTDAGRGIAVAPEVPPNIKDLQDAMCARVSGPQAAILRVLIAAYPEVLSRVDLGARAGQSDTSSGFEKNVSTLKSLGLIHYPSQWAEAALPVLFLEGA